MGSSWKRLGGLRRLLLPPLDAKAFWLRYWAGVLVLWAAAVFAAVPLIILGAYSGWIPFLGRFLSGRYDSELSEYMTLWFDRVPTLTVVYVSTAIIFALFLLIRRQPRIHPTEASPEEDEPPGWLGTLLVALWLGVVTGVGEAYYLTVRAFVLDLVPPGFRAVSPDSLWMAPIATTLVFAVLGILLAALGRVVPRRIALRLIATVLLLVTFDTWIRVTDRFGFWATTLLALGLAVQAGRFVAEHPRSFVPLMRRSAAPLCVLVVATFAVTTMLPIQRERGMLAELPDAPSGAPNLLIVILDTQRAASTSLYGSERPTTPELDRWAERGVVFDLAISPASWTLPSHATLFTGRHNFELGTDYFVPLDDRYPTLAEVLGAHGYRTGGFVANLDFGNPDFGLARGFAHYEAQPRSWTMALASSWLTRQWGYRLRALWDDHRYAVRRRSPSISRAFWSWLDEDPERPFFAFLNYFDAHDPYLPPAPFDTLFAPRGAQYWAQGSGGAHDEASSYAPEVIEELRATYESAIAYQDRHIGELMDRLDARGILNETVVVVTSDHGEEFGEHGRMLHGDDLYMPQIHVPLVLWLPDGPSGVRIAAAVGLRDIAATVLDALGLEAALPGTSLLPGLAEPAAQASFDWPPALSQMGVHVDWSLVESRYHYLRDRHGAEELYDIVADPGETTDLSSRPDHADVIARFREHLRREAGVEPPG